LLLPSLLGGRIGPQLFNVKDNTSVKPRDDKYRTSPYLSGFNTTNVLKPDGTSLNPGENSPGVPIPLSPSSGKFWLENLDDSVGGDYFDPDKVVFSIPNLLYDYVGRDYTASNVRAPGRLQVIQAGADPGSSTQGGLYNPEMFSQFRNNMRVSNTYGPDEFSEAIMKVRAPTLYDALNYLIPTPESLNDELGVDSFGVISSEADQDGVYNMKLYAPLYGAGDDYLFQSVPVLQTVLSEFVDNQEIAMTKYRDTLNEVAINMYNTTNTASNNSVALAAAQAISDIPDYTSGNTDQAPSCNSINGKFVYFFTGDTNLINSTDLSQCPEPLEEVFEAYWTGLTDDGRSDFYVSTFTMPESEEVRERLFSAYRPGPFRGAQNGVLLNPLNGSSEKMHRNFYSTKLVTLDSLSNSGAASYNPSANGFVLHSEGNNALGALEDIYVEQIVNPLDKALNDWNDTAH
jgi:hypothetical protein